MDPTDPQLWDRVLDDAAEAEDRTAAAAPHVRGGGRLAAGGVTDGEQR